MKKSVLSITVLIMLVAAALAFIGSSAAWATPLAKYTYNNEGNTQTVYRCDSSTLTLTPFLKYEYIYSHEGKLLSKTALRWDSYKKEWNYYYQIKMSREKEQTVLEYGKWNRRQKDFSKGREKAVYGITNQQQFHSYNSYRWNKKKGCWESQEV